MTRKRASAIAPPTRAGIGAVLIIGNVFGCHNGSGIEPQGSPPASDLPCEVETVVAARCWACHGEMPMPGAPSLTSAAAWIVPSISDPSRSTGAVAVARMQSTTTTAMPPPPSMAATAAEIATIAGWVESGSVSGSGCGSLCTSGTTWTGGDEGSPNMNPGMPCKRCHASDEGPGFSIAGTVYATAREPDRCNGAGNSSGAQIVITGADGRMQTLAPNEAGNFFSERAVAMPYRAKVVTAAGERAMTAEQTSGDCNGCHTPAGAEGAPGRIVLP